MKAILELDIDSEEGKLLFDFLQIAKISFKSTHLQEKEVAFEAGASATEIKESVQACVGMWKNRNDFKNFEDFRKQAWVEPEMIQSKPLTEKERNKLSQIILEAKAKNNNKLVV